jgi:ribonuclease D
VNVHTKPLTSNQQILELCSQIQKENIIAFDTEFLREKTYWPHICLLQIATPSDAFLVDTLAPNLSLEPLLEALFNPNITKIVHAGTQDIEGLFALSGGRVMDNIVDTQIMARFCSIHFQSSLETLLLSFCDTSLSKNERMSDWSLRPLKNPQCLYALSDVTHLHQLYDSLSQKIKNLERDDIVKQETLKVYKPELFSQKEYTAWQKIKANRIKYHAMPALKALAYWREKKAIAQNIPRQRIISDNAILAIAQNIPKSVHDLANIRHLNPTFKSGKKALEIFNALSNQSLFPQDPNPPPPNQQSVASPEQNTSELITLLLHDVAQKYHIAPQIIASSSDIRAIATGTHPQSILDKWRWDIFGKPLQLLLNGDIALGLKNNALTQFPIKPAP